MAEFKYPRFNTIYPTREEAIEKLDNLTRAYGEPVAIRYYNTSKTVCVLLAIFKSDAKGDYSISYDSNPETTPKVYTITKTDSSITDEEYINIALFGKTPIDNDIVILTDCSEDIPYTKSYIYTDNKWILLSNQGNGSIGSLDLGNSLVPIVNEDGSSRLEVKTDNSTISYSEEVGGLTVKKINGGTF